MEEVFDRSLLELTTWTGCLLRRFCMARPLLVGGKGGGQRAAWGAGCSGLVRFHVLDCRRIALGVQDVQMPFHTRSLPGDGGLPTSGMFPLRGARWVGFGLRRLSPRRAEIQGQEDKVEQPKDSQNLSVERQEEVATNEFDRFHRQEVDQRRTQTCRFDG